MQAISVKCPECNAVLDARGGDQVTCTYCGTPARVQRRTQFLQRPVPLPPMRPTDPHAIAVMPANKTGLIVLAIVLGATFTLVLVIVIAATSAGQAASTVAGSLATAGPTAVAARPRAPYWRGGPPLVLDVDGDGTDDVVGIRRYVIDKDAMALFALSGKDGHVLWEGPSLGGYSAVYTDPLALAGKTILRADRGANVLAVSATDGKPLWTAAFGEVVKRFCGATEGVIVRTADDKWAQVDLATGAHAAAKAPKTCGDLPVVTVSDKMVGVETLEHFYPKIPNMSARSVVDRPDDAGKRPAIALGYREPGTAVSMLAAIGPAPHWDKVAWVTELAAKDPLRAKLWGPEIVALDDDALATVYQPDAAGMATQLVLFARADGARRWDVPVPARGIIPMVDVDGLALTRDLVILTATGEIRGYDRATGALRWDIGDPD